MSLGVINLWPQLRHSLHLSCGVVSPQKRAAAASIQSSSTGSAAKLPNKPEKLGWQSSSPHNKCFDDGKKMANGSKSSFDNIVFVTKSIKGQTLAFGKDQNILKGKSNTLSPDDDCDLHSWDLEGSHTGLFIEKSVKKKVQINGAKISSVFLKSNLRFTRARISFPKGWLAFLRHRFWKGDLGVNLWYWEFSSCCFWGCTSCWLRC